MARSNRLAKRNESVPPAARAQPGRLVPVGRRGIRRGTSPQQARPALDRILVLSLVPRHGAGMLRRRRHRGADERALREHQGRSRGAARTSTTSTCAPSSSDRPRRLAAHGLSHTRPASPSTAERTSRRQIDMDCLGFPAFSEPSRRRITSAQRTSPGDERPARRHRWHRDDRRSGRGARPDAARTRRRRPCSGTSTPTTAASGAHRSFRTRRSFRCSCAATR
jgi:hypothetical protein